MGRSNIEVARQAIAAYNARDVAALCRLMREDVELFPPVSLLQGQGYTGHAGVDRWLRDLDESFEEAWIEEIELRDLGSRVVALTTFRVSGGGSHLPLESELGLLLDMEDGAIRTWLGFFSHAEALAAAETT